MSEPSAKIMQAVNDLNAALRSLEEGSVATPEERHQLVLSGLTGLVQLAETGGELDHQAIYYAVSLMEPGALRMVAARAVVELALSGWSPADG